MDRRRFARYAAPVAFLAAITIGVLIVRAGLEQGSARPRTTSAAQTTSTRTVHKQSRKKHHARTYRVQSGDTFGSIAQKLDTTVAKLEQLNPGIDPTSLHVGEKIRVQ